MKTCRFQGLPNSPKPSSLGIGSGRLHLWSPVILFLWTCSAASGSQFSNQELNLCPLHGERGLLTTGPPRGVLMDFNLNLGGWVSGPSLCSLSLMKVSFLVFKKEERKRNKEILVLERRSLLIDVHSNSRFFLLCLLAQRASLNRSSARLARTQAI